MNIDRKPILFRPDRSAIASEWRKSFIDDATIRVLAMLRKISIDEVNRVMRSTAPAAAGAIDLRR